MNWPCPRRARLQSLRRRTYDEWPVREITDEWGKPPDFVLQVASESTAEVDAGEMRKDYVALGIGEYWRFDETGRHHGTRLAGQRLVEEEYVAIDIEELQDGSLQGYSEALGLHLRWERGELVFYDPATGRRIANLEDERARADTAEARADAEPEARIAEQARAATKARAHAATEARIREPEELLRLQGN